MRERLLYWKEKLFILVEEELVHKILQEYHNSPRTGVRINITISRLRAQFYWPRMQEDIKDYVQKCLICQLVKASNTLPSGLLQPLHIPPTCLGGCSPGFYHIPQQIWEDVAMDFLSQDSQISVG